MFEAMDDALWETYESVSGGADPKMWVTDGSRRYLLKQGQFRFPLEPFSEYVASRVLKGIGLPVQDVELIKFRGSVWAKCSDIGEVKQFKDIKDSSIFSDVRKEFWVLVDLLSTIAGMKKFTYGQRVDFIEKFKLLFVADALIANGDRHAGNFGYTSTGEMSAVYDNGAALFPAIGRTYQSFQDVKELLYNSTVTLPISAIQVKPTIKHVKKDSYFTMLRDSNIVSDVVERVCELNIAEVALNAVHGLPEDFQRFYVYVLYLRFMVILKRVNFDKAYSELRRLPFKFPESVGELCTRLMI